MIYFLIICILLCLSFRFDVNGKISGKKFCYQFVMVIFIVLAGLRYRLGVDTTSYLYRFYHEYPSLSSYSWENFSIANDPLFVLLNSLIRFVGGRFFIVQFIHAAFVNIFIFLYIKKHSTHIFTCLLFYFIICYFNYNMEIMRGSMSIVLCLFANDYIIEKKWLKGLMLYLIACMFHAQTLLIILTPLLFFLRLNKRGILVLILSFLLGYFIQENLGSLIEIAIQDESLANRGQHYASSEEQAAQAGNIYYFAVNIIIPIVYVMLSMILIKRHNSNNRLFKLEPIVLIGIMFYLMQIHMRIAYRCVDYYRIYFVLYYADCFVLLTKNFKLSKVVLYGRSLILFLPFFLFYIYGFSSKGTGYRYYPYYTIIDRAIDLYRESEYIKTGDRANVKEW